MTLDKFYGALKPKIQGTKNLHEYSIAHSLNLKFFVMLSSLAGINGNPTQSNYAAGNTYQDALAHSRVAAGLPALTIDVGMVVDAGWSVDNWDRIATGVGLAWAKHMTTEHLLRLIEYNIRESLLENKEKRLDYIPAAPQVSMGIEEVRKWDARFSYVLAGQAQSAVQQRLVDKTQISLPDRIATAGADREELQNAILEGFCLKLSRLLDMNVEDVHHDDSLGMLGVDSLVAVEIRNWLAREGASVAMSEITGGKKSLRALVEGIVKERLRLDGRVQWSWSS